MWIECRSRSGGTGTVVDDFDHIFVDGIPLSNILADERAKVLDELRLLMKERADDCSDIPNMFDKGYYKAYEHMCEEIEQLKGQR